jgi:hypothetical protein
VKEKAVVSYVKVIANLDAYAGVLLPHIKKGAGFNVFLSCWGFFHAKARRGKGAKESSAIFYDKSVGRKKEEYRMFQIYTCRSFYM